MSARLLSAIVVLVAAGLVFAFFTGGQNDRNSIDEAIERTRNAATATVEAAKSNGEAGREVAPEAINSEGDPAVGPEQE